MPHIASRDRETDMSCPRCGGPITVREISPRNSQRPDDPDQWVIASRRCAAGCVLLASDLEELDEDRRA